MLGERGREKGVDGLEGGRSEMYRVCVSEAAGRRARDVAIVEGFAMATGTFSLDVLVWTEEDVRRRAVCWRKRDTIFATADVVMSGDCRGSSWLQGYNGMKKEWSWGDLETSE